MTDGAERSTTPAPLTERLRYLIGEDRGQRRNQYKLWPMDVEGRRLPKYIFTYDDQDVVTTLPTTWHSHIREYIVEACNAVPQLLDMLDAAEARNAALVAENERLRNMLQNAVDDIKPVFYETYNQGTRVERIIEQINTGLAASQPEGAE